MNYVRAYLKAWWELFRASSVVFVFAWLIGVPTIVGLYLLYLICVGSLAGPVGKWIGK